MNVCVFIGNLGGDPEVRVINSNGRQTSVAKFNLAVSRNYQKADKTWEQETTWVPCEAWDSGAERIGKTLVKGNLVSIEGSLKPDSWVDKETGKQRSRLFVRVSKFKNLTPRPKDTDNEAAPETSEVAVDGEVAKKAPF